MVPSGQYRRCFGTDCWFRQEVAQTGLHCHPFHERSCRLLLYARLHNTVTSLEHDSYATHTRTHWNLLWLTFFFGKLVLTIVVMLLLFLLYNCGSKMIFDDSDDFSTLFDGAGIHKRWWECDVCEISDDEDNVPLAVDLWNVIYVM